MKFSIGDLVVEKADIQPDSSYPVQKVAVIVDGALLLVHYGYSYDGAVHPESFTFEPGSRSWRSAFSRHQEEEFVTSEEAEKKRLQMKMAKTKLNEEFDAELDKIKTKLNQAAVLVKEAGNIVKAHDKEFYDLKQECLPLYSALKDGGWSHSTMKCYGG